MKTMPALFLAIAIFLPTLLFSQARQYPDSIRVELPQHGALVDFELRLYAKDKEVIRSFPSRLSEIIQHVKVSIPESRWREAHTVVVTRDKTDDEDKKSLIEIARKNEDVTRLRVEHNNLLELIPPGWQITIHTERAVVHVYAPDLPAMEAISQLTFEPVIAHLVSEEEFASPQRMGVFARVVMRGDHVISAGTGHRLPADMLGIHPGAGVGMAGDRFYPEFNANVALYFANRFHNNRQRIAVGYELKLFSGQSEDNTFRSRPASFGTLSYGINFRGGRPRWTALGVGYMIHNRSDLFTRKTLKFFLESDIGSEKLNLVPELYLTDDFKKSAFGLKLNYRF